MKIFLTFIILCLASTGFSDALYWQLNIEPSYCFANRCRPTTVDIDIRTLNRICRSAEFPWLAYTMFYEIASERAVSITDNVSNRVYSFSFEKMNQIEFGTIKLNGGVYL